MKERDEKMKREKNILSLKLKMYRQQNDMTQEDLAELLEVSDKSISKWELGKGYPSKKNMVKISEVLQVPLEVLMIEEQKEDNRLVKSLKYSFVSYCIIFGLTIFIRGIRNGNEYSNILSRDLSEILKIVLIEFGQNTYFSLLPAIIIGFVFYFYIFPKQKDD
jgi:transcriptional regulator with XRE-family HTH domain